MKIKNVGVVFFFFFFHNLFGQVISSDSLALVSLYNATNGPNWTSKANWLNTNVGQWQGVSIAVGRVTVVNLSNNQLSGAIPNEFCDLTALEYLYLSNNNLTGNLPSNFGNMVSLNTIDFTNNQLEGAIPTSILSFIDLADLFIVNNQFDELPDLTSLSEISNVLIANNKFTFEDIIPNRTILNFQYSPQDSIYMPLDTIADIKDTVVFNMYTSGSGNTYQWIKDGQNLNISTHIQGVTSSQLTINKIQLADSGRYTIAITNSLAPLLTLYRNQILLAINDTRLEQLFYSHPIILTTCGDGPIILKDTLNSLLPVSYQILTGDATLQTDTIIAHRPGEITIRCFHEGDDTYKPITRDSTITVNAPPFSVPIIEKNSPTVAGEPLQLSIINALPANYYWVSPTGDTTNNSNFYKDLTTDTDQGFYTLVLGDHDCIYYVDSIEVRFNSLNKEEMVYEYITPNGDTKNDFFFIEKNDDNSAVDVTILNTWGQQVYKNENYQNNWSGDGLPSGTYYYIVKFLSSNKLVKGALYLKH